MTKKKALAAILAVALIACVAVGATLAYLQDKTEVATNVFTLGKVDIKLDEAVIDEDGQATDERTEEGNDNYFLMPGQTVDKDPTVTVIGGSEECYVRVFVTLDHADEIYAIYQAHNMTLDSALEFFGGYDETVWEPVSMSSANISEGKLVVEFRYVANDGKVAKSSSDTVLAPVIETVTLPDFVNNTDTARLPDGFSVEVYAEAIQTKGFDDADAAWAAFDDTIDPFVAE